MVEINGYATLLKYLRLAVLEAHSRHSFQSEEPP